MEILQLRYFYESAKYENFAKVAEKFSVPASSVSASVKRLESELGVQLFDRRCNQILLNQNGKIFQQHLCAVFRELDSAVEKVSTKPSDTREIKLLVRANRNQITDLIIKYHQKYPNIIFKTVFDFSEENLENFDIIIDEKKDAYTEYECFELYTSELRLKASSQNKLCQQRLTLSMLSKQPFISWGEQSNMHTILLRACKNAGFVPNVVVNSNDSRCIQKLLEADIGIGIGFDAIGDTAFLDVSDFRERYTVYCFYKEIANFGNISHFLTFMQDNTLHKPF